MTNATDPPQVPVHIGFIVDGNRRWAKKHGLPTYEGHLAGHAATKEILPVLFDRGIQFVSLYLFSTENWKRSEDEVAKLMGLILTLFTDDLKDVMKHEVRVRVLGRRDRLSPKIVQAVADAEAKTAHYTRGTVAVCLDYGGQQEIADAAQACLKAGIKTITPETLREHLYAPDIPDIDFVVRTSGEQRLSNFMLWRAAYSEFMFMPKFWPDLRPADIDVIIKEYQKRNRRFGGS